MKRLDLLDYTRLFAALSVMCFHYLFNGIGNGKISSLTHIDGLIDVAKYGYLGVELFFMISGYVIFFSASGKTAAQFAEGRMIRLYPAFWAGVLITSLVAQFLGSDKMGVTVTQIVANLTMFPQIFGKGFVDGVYWTLQYEMLFYALVFTLLAIWKHERLEAFFIAWPIVMFCASFTALSKYPLLGNYYGYFAAGALFAILKNSRSPTVLISLALACYVCVSYSVASAVALAKAKGIDYPGLIVGLIVASQFLLFSLLTVPSVARVKLPGARLAGALTYPVYLIHAHVGYMLLSRFATDDNKIWMYPLVACAVTGVAYLMNFIVERQMADTWRAVFGRGVRAPLERLLTRQKFQRA